MHSLATPTTLKLLSLSSATTTTTTTLFSTSLHRKTTIITASSSNPPPPIRNIIIPKNSSPASPQPQNLYQPYRPPRSPLPEKYKNLDTLGIIDILSNRFGFWYEYAPLISSLFRDGFTPPSIEELTGISGVEQNRFVVAAQVRDSIAESTDTDPDVLRFFDNGGSEILYELRLLNATQRVAAATYVVYNKLDGDKARDIARAIKDFPGRQLVPGWNRFDYTKPGDCWAFTFFRQSRDNKLSQEKRKATLGVALKVAESEEAKMAVIEEMEGKTAGDVLEKMKDHQARVPVVRLCYGEVAEATSVIVLPVCKAEEKGKAVVAAPREVMVEGEFGVVVSDKGWDRWVVLPKWVPVAELGKEGFVVEFEDGRALPWRTNMVEEPILVVVDRKKSEVVTDDGFYLVVGDGDGELKLVRGIVLMETGVKQSLGMVVMVARPPRDEDEDALSDEDWD